MASTAPRDSGPPGPHHDPPSELTSVELPLKTTSQLWFRGHSAKHAPLYFGRSRRHRFDDLLGEFGTLYVGQDAHCVFIETFGHETGETDFVTWASLEARSLSRIEASRSLRLVDLSGSGLARLRADARLCTGSVSVAQRWARAFFEHPSQPDGVYYRSRHDPQKVCAALFDRAAGALGATSLGSLADPANARLLADILDDYGFGLIMS